MIIRGRILEHEMKLLRTHFLWNPCQCHAHIGATCPCLYCLPGLDPMHWKYLAEWLLCIRVASLWFSVSWANELDMSFSKSIAYFSISVWPALGRGDSDDANWSLLSSSSKTLYERRYFTFYQKYLSSNCAVGSWLTLAAGSEYLFLGRESVECSIDHSIFPSSSL